MKLDAKQLRASKPRQEDIKKIKRRGVYIVCDNVLDTYNIGSIFRLADAVGAREVCLCGGSETPPNSKIAKAAVGTEKWVPWTYFATASEAIEALRERHSRLARPERSRRDRESADPRFREDDNRMIRVIAIEQGKGSIDFRKVNYQLQVTSNQALAFIVGHETDGVSKEALEIADLIVEIPMFGVNRSLNVMVSLAIVLFRAI